jgi:molybdopterin-containing oxidoreductase family iron-sulfur binding subunit
MEKCSFCVQRLRRGEVNVERRGIEPLTGERIPTADRKLDQRRMKEGNYLPACVQSCPTNALQFADQHDDTSPVKGHFDEANEQIETREHGGHVDESHTRVYRLFEEIGTKPNVIYLKKVDAFPLEKA